MKDYPAWKTWAWRLIRGAVATAAAQTLTLQVDWSKPEIAYKTLVISFTSGFLMAVGVAIRDEIGGKDKSAVVHKLPV